MPTLLLVRANKRGGSVRWSDDDYDVYESERSAGGPALVLDDHRARSEAIDPQSRIRRDARAGDDGLQKSGGDCRNRGRKKMTNEWARLKDEELAKIAQDGLQGQGAPVEAMRRLRVAIEQASSQNDIYSRRMYWLTVIVTLMTLIQVAALFPAIWDWWSKVGPAIWAWWSHG